MKVISFNINSVRARLHQIEHIRDNLDPDVIGLQETKVNDPEFPIEAINEIGYHVEHWGGKAHYGVAMLSKESLLNALKALKMIPKKIKSALFNVNINLKMGLLIFLMDISHREKI